jgi:hypothetical protein
VHSDFLNVDVAFLSSILSVVLTVGTLSVIRVISAFLCNDNFNLNYKISAENPDILIALMANQVLHSLSPPESCVLWTWPKH